jgi:hypothetical protein
MSINIINLNIKNIFLGCREKKKKIHFDLIKHKPIRYNQLIPDFGKDFLYLKILKCGKIISRNGNFAKYLSITKVKNIKETKTCCDFFDDFIIPIFEECLKKKEPFQFNFSCYKKKKEKEYKTCSFYPCFIPLKKGEKISSIDLVIRDTKVNIEKENISNYIIL